MQEYWGEELDGYEETQTVFFDGVVNTACGNASSAVGPSTAPADQRVYIDLGFFDELEQDLAPTVGPSPRHT